MKKILGAVRKAVQDYDMIEEGDRVAVGVSGGKDSLVLFESLWRLSQFYPKHFEVVPIHVDMGFADADREGQVALADYFSAKGTPLVTVPTQLAEILFGVRKGEDACSLCSKMRRGALCTTCNQIGCNKLALGHHADDVLETMLMSFIYEGRLSTFEPKSLMDRTGITVIRPMVYVYESDIRGVASRCQMPVLHNPCPADHHTTRERMKDLVRDIQRDISIAKDNMVRAIEHPERYHLWKRKEK
ncbi:MAG: tRNA 2-thiocytidine(32) synthetase TtcA [Clostridia bacterium]|nr:tRNA 2-thiocytidine(32) synthetase TtcA [Clostridia bacterium]